MIGVLGPVIVADGKLESYYVLIFGSMALTLVLSISGALSVKERVEFGENNEEKYSLKEMLQFLRYKPNMGSVCSYFNSRDRKFNSWRSRSIFLYICFRGYETDVGSFYYWLNCITGWNCDGTISCQSVWEKESLPDRGA